MRAITIHQPWASLIACGAKTIETRGWPTKYRGPLAIHAGKALPRNDKQIIADTLYAKNQFHLPLGAVIAVAELVDCLHIVYHPGTNVDIAKTIEIGAESMTLNKRDPDFGHYIVPSEQEVAFGDWTPGRYAWKLANIRPITPVPAKGMQRLWEWEG